MTGSKVYLLGAIALGTIGSLWGSSPAIGVATANGTFAVNKTQVSGSATLFDGALVETGKASSRLDLANGSHLNLNANSSVELKASGAVLKTGSGELGAVTGFSLEARTLRIETGGANATADVRLNGERNVLVKALNGPVRVFSKTGVLVALVNAGMGVTLDPYAAPPEDFDMSGCLLAQSAGPLFGLAVDNVLYQVSGPNLNANVGNRVHIAGASTGGATLDGASALVNVTKLEMTDVAGCQAAAARFPGMTATPNGPVTTPVTTPPAKGKSHTGAIIAGVAVAGAAGGITAAVCCKSH